MGIFTDAGEGQIRPAVRGSFICFIYNQLLCDGHCLFVYGYDLFRHVCGLCLCVCLFTGEVVCVMPVVLGSGHIKLLLTTTYHSDIILVFYL